MKQRKSSDSESTEVCHEGKMYDVEEFLIKHPGGELILRANLGKDITNAMKGVPSGHKHSDAAYHLLREYGKDEEKIDRDKDVDWSKGILFQVGDLGAEYIPWLERPVLRKYRLFDNALCDWLTTSRWYYVPILWLPVAMYLLLRSAFVITGMELFVLCILGMALWSLSEYCIHRWLFHLEPPASSRLFITLHFLFHGLHHKAPFDDSRLVFPPTATFVFFVVFYMLWHVLLPPSYANTVLCGMLVGYIWYDLTHYYLHHGSPTQRSFFYVLKRRHTLHHFVHKDRGFGISSSFWDGWFGTKLDD